MLKKSAYIWLLFVGVTVHAQENTLRASVDAETRIALLKAVAGAAQRISEPLCSAVFGDFSDAGNRPLDQVLADSGFTATEYLSLVFFVDGSGERRCQDGSIGAFASPGARVVRVCSGAIKRKVRSDPDRIELLLIHELLHVLGAQEAPAAGAPTSEEIDERVFSRCR